MILVDSFAARLLKSVELWCFRSHKIVYISILNFGESQLLVHTHSDSISLPLEYEANSALCR